MELQSCMLCDFAEIREHLLFVLGGGVQRFNACAFPAPIPVQLAGLFEVDAIDTCTSHELLVTVVDAAGDPIGEIAGQMQCAGLDVDQVALLPWVMSLAGLSVPAPGDYEVRVVVDGENRTGCALRATEVNAHHPVS
jgi:hypothetical protein